MRKDELEFIMQESLLDHSKLGSLPKEWQNSNFNINFNSNTRKLIQHFAYYISLELEARKKKFKINDKVKLPLDQEGILIEIVNLPWGHTHVVRITKATLNDLDDIEYYKKEELELIEEK